MSNFRFGGELRATEALSLRAGYELFGNPLNNKKRTQRKPMTWLDKEAKNSDNLLHQTKDLPLLQAAIIRKRKM